MKMFFKIMTKFILLGWKPSEIFSSTRIWEHYVGIMQIAALQHVFILLQA